MNKENILRTILDKKVIAVIRVKEEEKLNKVIEAVYTGGISVIEITMTVPNAIRLIENVSDTFGEKILVGVGSVLNSATAEDAIKAGAKYVVSPVFKKEILETAQKYNVPAMPGAFTPTEIQTAYEAGADIVKVFPADIVGMNFFKAILAPLPHLKLMPTGGVSLNNAGDWLKAGACAVGVGSALLDKNAIMNERYDILTNNARIINESINAIQKQV
ncbi:MAG: bifunctional 4-hydroxy-2-oxoglutarate aldolase/2-dehydro-3-deoxy-phosphogluconate aldolase [Ignavibacteriales bacterium]|nr:MAG: bifunctional 4-hydroxy-2-oxoglutarate aldolase/2-dehydro-3-deoxy-phosphogluconate aldolase [Ignavibacteriales bacterium]